MPNILENGGNFGKNSINVVVIFTAQLNDILQFVYTYTVVIKHCVYTVDIKFTSSQPE